MTSPSILDLPHNEDCLPLLALLSSMPLPVILESNRGSQDSGTVAISQNSDDHRFTIVCADPVASLIVSTAISTDVIFNKIRALQKKHLSIDEPLSPALAELPFQGGIAGFLGYPKISNRAELQVSNGFLGVYHWAVVVDHSLARTRLVFHPNCSKATKEKLHTLLAHCGSDLGPELHKQTGEKFSLRGKFQPQTSYNNYKQAFEKIKNYILKGDCYQVNLTQKFTSRCTGSPFDAFSKLRVASPAPFSAFIQWPGGALISLSPERFMRNQQGHLETKPIKGTRARSADAMTDKKQINQLVNSTKDKAENLMIVDLLRNDLGRVCETGSIKVPDLFSLKTYSNVHHLVSTVTGTLRANFDSIDMLRACFPGGSITGAPKLRAMEIIEEVEESNRGPYCGSVFYWAASGDFDSNITIRTLQWRSSATEATGTSNTDIIECWAGGGIVADSDCESEYQECFDKVQNLITTLESL
ncbi:MAG: para-aminobenzoate synthetase component 1 [Pseudohongiellaceae bacterium]|jgi:para-aminobenzoate synthetase component 1